MRKNSLHVLKRCSAGQCYTVLNRSASWVIARDQPRSQGFYLLQGKSPGNEVTPETTTKFFFFTMANFLLDFICYIFAILTWICPTALRRVQITPKTSTNIRRYMSRYLYSSGPVRQVFSQRASDELDWSYEKREFGVLENKSLVRRFVV